MPRCQQLFLGGGTSGPFLGSELGSMSESMTSKVEGTNLVLLKYNTRKRARRTKYGTWATPVTINGLNADGIQTSGTCIGRKNGTVAQWVDI